MLWKFTTPAHPPIFSILRVSILHEKCVCFRVVETMKIFRKLQEICVRVCECMFESVLLTITGFQLNSMISQNLNLFQNNVPLYSIPAFYIIVLEIIRRNNISYPLFLHFPKNFENVLNR